MDNEKILEALKTIKEVCQTNSCNSCPLRYRSQDCVLLYWSPDTWTFNDDSGPWRAFEC